MKALDTKLNEHFGGKVVRKDLLDFCYVIDGEKSIPWKMLSKKMVKK